LLLKEKIVSHKQKKETFIVTPCISEAGLVVVETYLFYDFHSYVDFLDMPLLYQFLAAMMSSLRFSERLGIASFVWENHEILISSSGKVTVRNALHRKDAEDTLKKISRLSWGACICQECGLTTIESSFLNRGCYSLEGPPRFGNFCEDAGKESVFDVGENLSSLLEYCVRTPKSGILHTIGKLYAVKAKLNR